MWLSLAELDVANGARSTGLARIHRVHTQPLSLPPATAQSHRCSSLHHYPSLNFGPNLA